MKTLSSILLLTLSTAALAQYGSYADPQQLPTPVGKSPLNVFFGAGYAAFRKDIHISGESAHFSADGTILTLDKTFAQKSGGFDTVGAWYYTGGDGFIEIHGRHFFKSRLGVQVGVLTSPNDTSLVDFDAFGLYSLPLNKPQEGGVAFDGAVGAGVYRFDRPDKQYQPTAFVQASAHFPNNFGVEASYWYIDLGVGSSLVSRFAITGSYRF